MGAVASACSSFFARSADLQGDENRNAGRSLRAVPEAGDPDSSVRIRVFGGFGRSSFSFHQRASPTPKCAVQGGGQIFEFIPRQQSVVNDLAE